MEFLINKEVLTEGLNKVLKVINGKHTAPVLSGILVEVKSDYIMLTGSNTNETIKHCIEINEDVGQVINEGSVVLPKQVAEISKKLKKHILFEKAGLKVKITSGKSEFELNCMDADEYPAIDKFVLEDPALILKGSEFKGLLNKTTFAASESESRVILQGVCMEIQDNKLTMVCTDSHRLARVEMKSDSDTNLKITVPAKSLENSLKIFEEKHEIEIFIQNDRAILMKNGNTAYLLRLLEGNYPDTSRLLPSNFESEMKIKRTEMLKGLDLIWEIAKEADSSSKGNGKIHVNGQITLSSFQAQTGQGKVEMAYEELTGKDDFTISFSIKYLSDALKAMDSEIVVFKYLDPLRPFILCPAIDSNISELQLVLPIRTIYK